MVVKRRTRGDVSPLRAPEISTVLTLAGACKVGLLVARATHIDACHCASPTLGAHLGSGIRAGACYLRGACGNRPIRRSHLGGHSGDYSGLTISPIKAVMVAVFTLPFNSWKTGADAKIKNRWAQSGREHFLAHGGVQVMGCGRHSFPWPRWLRCSCTISLGATTSVTGIGMFGRGSRHTSGPVPSLGADHHFGRDDRCYG